ncbi:unnamed protein product [Heterobilharzia americana]|nr:unnamed protein product [Heterobilharzia americana]
MSTRSTQLSCPMLKKILQMGRSTLFAKYSKRNTSDGQASHDDFKDVLSEDQILAYIHYPPTFYRLHVHFMHVDSGDSYGTIAGRAHILEEVIRNLEQNDLYYAERTITIFLHDRSPMFVAVCEDSCQKSTEDPIPS